MFTFLSRFRRQTAVLTTLALVASVLVAVPVSAADDPPKPSYEATFSACVGEAEDSQGFTDVQAADAGRADIDCIGYYGITMGTGDGSTYSPLMSVTREHMALFLIRLAKVVGIEMASDPADPGFTDIGDLGDESQTAIAQLKALEITRGNNSSGTTYGPADPVTRGQMALFIARLMNQMAPMSNGGADTMADWGYTPDDVKKNKVQDDGKAREVLSPFTDLERVTKETFDSITWLYELGVASGSHGSPTQYSPFQQITRRSMAQFMAGVLHHSNARPSGLTVQANPTSGFAIAPTVVASVRTEMFAPVSNQPVDAFSSNHARTMGLKGDGTCNTDQIDGDGCEWTDSDEVTNKQGNLQVDLEDDAIEDGKTTVVYVWIGTEDGDEFDKDDANYSAVSIASHKPEASMKVTTSLPDNVGSTDVDHDGDGTADQSASYVHLGRTGSVTITVQLRDDADKPVAREGVTINVGVLQNPADGNLSRNTSVGKWDTDADGKIEYVVNGPTSTDDDDSRVDTITLTYEGKATVAINPVVVYINWIEAVSAAAVIVGDAPVYVVPDDDDEVVVTVSAVLYDQYGTGYDQPDDTATDNINEGEVTFTFDDSQLNLDDSNADTTDDQTPTDDLNRNGKASVRVRGEADAGTPISPTIAISGLTGDDQVEAPSAVQVVDEAGRSNTGAVTADRLMAKENKFLADTADTPDGNSDLVYSYDKDDTFIFDATANGYDKGDDLTIDEFEELLSDGNSNGIPTSKATVDVVVYRPNGISIFTITSTG